jgi:predicted secreted hydrolase
MTQIRKTWILGLALAVLADDGAAAPPPGRTADGFAIPQLGHVFDFPRDDGAHPEFRIEWWYVTGHLFAADERRFGFQATFFRLAGPPGVRDDNPDFSRREVLLAHMALTDGSTGQFWHEERLNRAGWDAHAAVGTLDLTNGEWALRLLANDPPQLDLRGGVRAEVAFHLNLTAAKPLVIFGEDGVSHKGAEPSAASYYLTFSRLKTQGQLTLGEESLEVHGEAWMDHEISSSQLGRDQVGWDWTCVQFRDQPRELMLYQLRRTDGSADPASRLQWVTPGGKAVSAPYTWEVQSTWTSPASHAKYPARIRLTTQDPVTHAPVILNLEPLASDQELTNSLGGGPYWEGACRVLDPQGRDLGSAYLELTGYAKALKF